MSLESTMKCDDARNDTSRASLLAGEFENHHAENCSCCRQFSVVGMSSKNQLHRLFNDGNHLRLRRIIREAEDRFLFLFQMLSCIQVCTVTEANSLHDAKEVEASKPRLPLQW